MKYGYAQFFPTDDKKADLRTADLKKAGCRYVFTDSASSGRKLLNVCRATLYNVLEDEPLFPRSP